MSRKWINWGSLTSHTAFRLYNLKNVRNTHAGKLLLVKLQTFSRFLNCTDGTKWRKASHILYTSNFHDKMTGSIFI